MQVSINEEDVPNAVAGLKVDESPGSDRIFTRLIQKAREEIAAALDKIFKPLLYSSEIPND